MKKNRNLICCMEFCWLPGYPSTLICHQKVGDSQGSMHGKFPPLQCRAKLRRVKGSFGIWICNPVIPPTWMIFYGFEGPMGFVSVIHIPIIWEKHVWNFFSRHRTCKSKSKLMRLYFLVGFRFRWRVPLAFDEKRSRFHGNVIVFNSEGWSCNWFFNNFTVSATKDIPLGRKGDYLGVICCPRSTWIIPVSN